MGQSLREWGAGLVVALASVSARAATIGEFESIPTGPQPASLLTGDGISSQTQVGGSGESFLYCGVAGIAH
jgi:hypothetical protein